MKHKFQQPARRRFIQTGSALLAAPTLGLWGQNTLHAQTQMPAIDKNAMDNLLQNAVTKGDVPGVVACVTNSRETLYQGAFGERVLGSGQGMNMDTVMWLASMTKPIVSTAAMQLIEQGKMGLDQAAEQIIPQLGDVKVLSGWDSSGQPILRNPKSKITIRQLLTHTAGFTYDIWNRDTARFHKTLNVPRAGSGKKAGLNIPLTFDPGTQWEYGINMDWMGQIIEAVSGKTLGNYIKENITDPLGMMSTSFRLSEQMRDRMAKVHQRSSDGVGFTVTKVETNQNPEFEPGGGGLYSTANDYLQFVRMILNKGTYNGHRILTPQTVALMSRNAMGALRVKMLPSQNMSLSLDAEFFPGLPKTWGLGFMINEERAPTGRSAGGLSWAGLANTFFWIDPSKDIAGILMVQVLPFVDTKTLNLFTQFEKNVYAA